MWTRIYAIYDTTAEQLLGGLILVPSDAAAIRLFADSAANAGKGHLLYDHLEDFRLVCLGEFNQISGTITQKQNDDRTPFDDQNNIITTGKHVLRQWSGNPEGEAPPSTAPETAPALSLTGL